jgi:hypothetical protein
VFLRLCNVVLEATARVNTAVSMSALVFVECTVQTFWLRARMENNVKRAHLSGGSEPGELLLLLTAVFPKRCIVVSSTLYVLRLFTPAGPHFVLRHYLKCVSIKFRTCTDM